MKAPLHPARFYGIAAVMLLTALALIRPAAAEEPEPVRFWVKASIFRVELNEASRFGSEMSTHQMEDLVTREGTRALGHALEQSGSVRLVGQVEAEEKEGAQLRAYSGGETPHMAVMFDGEGERRTTTQRTVTTGTTIQIKADTLTERIVEIDYRIEHDMGVPRDSDGATLIGRERYSTSGTTLVDSDSDVVVKRQVNTALDNTIELIIVMEVRRL